jgi:hypothetical protein
MARKGLAPGPRRLESLLDRPRPPAGLLADGALSAFLPAPELDLWARAAFLEESSALFNVDHEHLASARIAWLWTNVTNIRQMRAIVGTAEIPRPPQSGGAWARAKWEIQMRSWFPVDEGEDWQMPDFLITLYAPFCFGTDDASFCATVEHEMLHCAQATDEFGLPAFSRSGRPKFAIQSHDSEEFVSVVRRYGPGAAAGGTAALVAAGNRHPEIASASIAGVCGTCRSKAA